MSETQWCDIDDPETNAFKQIGHPFSKADANKREFTETKTIEVPTGNSYGRATYQEREEVTTVVTMCGYHWEKNNPFSQKRAKTAIAELEGEKSAYEAGFEAGEQHAKYRNGNVD